MRFLVTAGNTRQPIDRVRDWGNIFTGNTGYAIARALTELGHVDLVTSNAAHLAEIAAARGSCLYGKPFDTHAQLKVALQRCMAGKNYDAIFMTAAVADYTPDGAYAIVERECLDDGVTEKWTVRNVQAGKVKSSYDRIAIAGKRTEKLVDLFRKSWRYRGMLVKFKLEVGIGVDELLKIGEDSRLASGADYLVANTLEMVNGLKPGAYLLRTGGHEWVDRDRLPSRLAQLVREHHQTVA